MNYISCGIIMWAQVFFRFVTIQALDRQTDGRTADGPKGLGNTVRCITCIRSITKKFKSNTCTCRF